jgi:hypothetical protein
MRLIVPALAVISVTFAGTTLYFAHELELERERSRATPAAVVRTAAVNPSTAVIPAQSSAVRAAPPSPAAPPALASQSTVAESEEDRMKRLQVEQSRRTLKMLEDPEQREGMIIEFKMGMRNSYPRLAQTIGLSSEETERLFELLALQQMEAQETYARCTVDPGCNVQDGRNFQNDPRAKEIADLLGADRSQQFDHYKNTLSERESVAHLRSRLSDSSRLPDGTAEALITALADERQRIHQEAAGRGIGLNGYGTSAGVVFSASNAPTPEAQFESAQANSRRMRERAAEVLNGEQLRVFDEMQDELLISLKHQVRQKEEFAADSSFATATVVN